VDVLDVNNLKLDEVEFVWPRVKDHMAASSRCFEYMTGCRLFCEFFR